MPYIGKNPVGGGFHKLDAMTASATDTYALTLNSAAYYPESANQLLVSLNGVIQAPQDSFTVSGSNLVFDTALTASDSIDFVVALGDVLAVKTVTDGAITTAKLGNGAVTSAKLAGLTSSDMPTGCVLQVKSATKTDKQSTTSATPSDVTGLSVSITPTSTSSKILVMTNINFGGDLNVYGAFDILRGSSKITESSYPTGNQIAATIAVGGDNNNFNFKMMTASHNFLDSPASTSALTYKVQFASTNTSAGPVELTINAPNQTQDANYIVGGTSTITVMEIAG